MKSPSSEDLKGCYFILRAIDDEMRVHPHVFMVTDKIENAVIAGKILLSSISSLGDLNQSGYSNVAIEVWALNEPIPRMILAHSNNPDSDSEKPIEKSTETATAKPEGLTGDKNISDILLEAFEAMQPTNKNNSDKSSHK